jgi:ATP synthase protein I
MSPPDEPSIDSRKLDDIGRRLEQLEQRAEASGTIPRKKPAVPNTALGSALRLSTEFVAALVVGGGLGWLLDEWWGTRPFAFLVFLGLGIAAGFLEVFRVAWQMQAKSAELVKNSPAMPVSDDED